MKIAFFEVENEVEKQTIKDAFDDKNELKVFNDILNPKNVQEVSDFDIISVFIYSNVDKQVLSKLSNLKLIATRSTGFDHIDIKKCNEKNIVVSNVPSYGENTVAEHAFALILALSRNVCKAAERTREEKFTIEGLIGFDLKGKTIGVVGVGDIGLHVIRIAKGFGMNVLAYDVKQSEIISEVLGFEYTSLENLLANSDIVTLHVPENKATHHLMNKERFKQIKKGALLINTSRGGIIDTEALIRAVKDKTLAGVGLDVIEGEKIIKEEKEAVHDKENRKIMNKIANEQALFCKDNFIFTPHIAFYSKEALKRILDTTIKNIQSFLLGEAKNKVT
jgi:D-lactate dehydrogenase